MAVLSLDTSRSTSPIDTDRRGRSTCARETVTTEMPRPIIDLSETPLQIDNTSNNNGEDEDDDVIIVSSNLQPVVDLCTPNNQRLTPIRRRRHSVNRSTLSRRRLTVPDVNDVETCVTARKRRTINRRKSSDISLADSLENSTPASNTSSSDHARYTCAVCLESYFQRKPTTTRCGHVFCEQCITEAIRLTRKCPMCNAKVSRTQIHRLYL